MVRFGILGFGHHAVRRLMPGFEKATRAQASAFWRNDPEKARQTTERYGLRSFPSAEELCASADVDAIFVASPDALHLAHVLLALKHRKPVLCEKPMAMNAGECERMIAAAERAGVLLGIAHNFRFNRSVERVRDIVRAGTLGRIFLARSEFHYMGRTSPRTWIADPKLACGGPVGDVAVHCIDAMRFILDDEPKTVFARATKDEYSGEVEAAAAMLFEFERGAMVEIGVSARGEYRTPLSLFGSQGGLDGRDALSVDHPVKLTWKAFDQAPQSEELSNGDAYARQVDAFAASMRDSLPFACTALDGLRNQLAVDAVYRSMANGTVQGIATL
jgi:predicted dehydrogenase